jgi:L-lactate dehydrogenase
MPAARRKIVIVGAGHVGSHVGYALATQGLAEEIVFIDIDKKKAQAQALDIYDSTVYLRRRTLVRAGGYADARDADLLVIAAGPLPDLKRNQTRMDTLQETVAALKDVVANIRESGFAGIILDISNPADVITHYVQNRLGYPPKKILSTSTTLDSARLRRALSEAFGIDQKSVYAYVLGEHGESQMVPWSTVTIAGKPVLELIAEKPEKYGKLDLDAVAADGRAGGWRVLAGKGSTEFGIGTAAAEVIRAILCDEKRVLPVSTLLDGEYGQKDVYASVPAVLGRGGVEGILELHLTEPEQRRFSHSCDVMRKNYRTALSL